MAVVPTLCTSNTELWFNLHCSCVLLMPHTLPLNEYAVSRCVHPRCEALLQQQIRVQGVCLAVNKQGCDCFALQAMAVTLAEMEKAARDMQEAADHVSHSYLLFIAGNHICRVVSQI